MSIIKFLVDLYLIILLLRFFLQLFGAHSYNSAYAWVIKLSSPPVRLFEKLLPTHRQFNWACLLLILVIKLVELLLFIWLQLNTWPHMGGLVIVAIGQLLYLTANVFFFSIILQAILSWVTMIQRKYLSIQEPLATLTNPLLIPVRRILPNLGGLDLSAIPILIGLQLVQTFLLIPIIGFGVQLLLS